MRTIERAVAWGLAVVASTALGGCAARNSTPLVPSELRFVSRDAWGANAPVLPMREHAPARLTIHHTATKQDPARDVGAKLRGLQAFSQRDDSLGTGRKKPAWGNFQRDSLSTAQRRTLDVLIPSLARRFGIPAERLASHRDYARTDCPGEHLYAQLPRLRALIDTPTH